MKFTIPGVVPVTIPVSDEHVRPYKGPDDPPLEWYKIFCSAQYTIAPVYPVSLKAGGGQAYSAFQLTPVIGRPVYTFDTVGEFIQNTREFTVRLFTTQLAEGVAQYRMHRSPVRVHCVYPLPPAWTWRNSRSSK